MPSKANIIVVDDDQAITELVRETLELEGYDVVTITDPSEVDAAVAEENPDLILLDVIMPGTNGLVVLSRLRSQGDIPVVLLSGSKRREDPVLGLRLGADDFISKPFDIDELKARIEAVLRRRGNRRQSRDVHKIGELTIDRTRRQVRVGADLVDLTPTEFNLLSVLASDPEKVFSRDELGQLVWGCDQIGDSRMVDVQIRRLRQKLETSATDVPLIATVRGVGYKLTQTIRTASESAPAPLHAATAQRPASARLH
ncbi:MAG: response regulator transcription factor [Chloroflexi bacterium]|nr:response regulator transcription factor [Chloroflexota bacterium]